MCHCIIHVCFFSPGRLLTIHVCFGIPICCLDNWIPGSWYLLPGRMFQCWLSFRIRFPCCCIFSRSFTYRCLVWTLLILIPVNYWNSLISLNAPAHFLLINFCSYYCQWLSKLVCDLRGFLCFCTSQYVWVCLDSQNSTVYNKNWLYQARNFHFGTEREKDSRT